MKKLIYIIALSLIIVSCKKSNDENPQPTKVAKGYYLTSSTFNDYDSIVIGTDRLYSLYNGLLVYRLPLYHVTAYGYEFRNHYNGQIAKCKGVISGNKLTATWSKYNDTDTTINILPNVSHYEAYY